MRLPGVLLRSRAFFTLTFVLLAVTWSPEAHAEPGASGNAVSLFVSQDGEDVNGASVPGSTDVRVAQISTAALSSAPQRLQLSLIGGASITATKRPDVSVDPVTTPLSSEASVATASLSLGQTIAFSADNSNLYAGVPVWIGDVDGQPNPGTGAVVLVMQPDGTTYASARYIDTTTKKLRSFRIEPIQSSNASPASTASASSSPHTIKEVLETRNPRRQRASIPRGINPNDPKVVAKWDLSLAARLGTGSAPTIPPGGGRPVHVANSTTAEQIPVSSPSPEGAAATAAKTLSARIACSGFRSLWQQ